MSRSLLCVAVALGFPAITAAQFPRVTVDGRELSRDHLRDLVVAFHGAHFLEKWELLLLCRQELEGRRARSEPVPDLADLDARVEARVDDLLSRAKALPQVAGPTLYEFGPRRTTRDAVRFLTLPDVLFESTFFGADPGQWPDFLRLGLEEPTMLGQFESMRLRAMRLRAGDPEVKPFSDLELRIRRSVLERLLRETADVRHYGQPLEDGAVLAVNGEVVHSSEVWPLLEPSLSPLDVLATARFQARFEILQRAMVDAGLFPGPGERLRELTDSQALQTLGMDLLRAAGVPSLDAHRLLQTLRLGVRERLAREGVFTRAGLEERLARRPDLHPGTMVQASVLLFASWDFELDRHLGAAAHEQARERAVACRGRLAAGESFDALREELCEFPVNLLSVRRDVQSTLVQVPDCARGAFEPKKVTDLEFFLGIRPYRVLTGPPTFTSFPFERLASPVSTGAVEGPLEVPYGFVILRIDDVRPGPPLDLRLPLLRDQVAERVVESEFQRWLVQGAPGHEIAIAFD